MGNMGVMGWERGFDGWCGREDFEFDLVFLGEGRLRGALVAAEHLFAVEGNFLAFEIERGKSFDGGDEFEQLGCPGAVRASSKAF